MEHRTFDLDVPLATVNEKLLARLFDAGYQCIAISQSVNIDEFNFSAATDSASNRKKTKEERQAMRSTLRSKLMPPERQLLESLLAGSYQYRAFNVTPASFFKPHLFRRITLCCSDSALAGHFFREFGELLNAFDIVGFCPMTAEALGYACEQCPSLDIITMDLSVFKEVRFTSKQCSSLINRGLHIEFQTSCILRAGSSGSTARAGLANYLSQLLSAVRPSFSRALVFSSSATCGWEVRRPLAVISILECLGLRYRDVAKSALTTSPYAVLVHGLTRSRTAHGAAALLRIFSMPHVTSIMESTSSKQAEVADDETLEERPKKKKRLK